MTATRAFRPNPARTIGAMLLGALLAATAAIPALAQGPTPKHIYPPIAAAQTDLNTAIAEAHRTHKRVLVDFGGDWCPDCQVLDIYAHQSPNAELLSKYFVKVNINIGRIDTNLDIARRCGVDLHGVPALAVLDSHGKVLFAQHNEFSDMRHMKSSDLTAFLNQWKQ